MALTQLTDLQPTNIKVTGIATFDQTVDVDGNVIGDNATNISGINSVTATTFYGSGANLTGISVDATKIETGNTKVEIIDTGSDGHIKFTTEGTERARLNSSGRLGLGTTNPDTTLTVQSGGDAQMSLKNSSGTTKAYVGTAGAFGSAGTDDLRIRSDSSNIVFGFSGAEKLRIKANGDVGIGTTNPTTNLHIVSDKNALIKLVSTDANSGIQFIDSDTGNKPPVIYGIGDDFTIWTDYLERLRVTSDGNTGIGTTNPSALLHVEKDGTSQVLARFESNLGTSNDRFVSLTSPTIDSINEPFTFTTGNSYQFKCDAHIGLHIDHDGNVGIDTGIPRLRSDIGGVSATGIDALNNPILYAGLPQANANGWGGVILGAGSNGNTPIIAASKTASGAALPLVFQTNATSRMTITGDGTVTKPQQPYVKISGITNQTGSGNSNDGTATTYGDISYSAGKVTAQVEGNYLITFATISDNGTGRVDGRIRVNGSNIVQLLTADNGSGYRQKSGSIVWHLNVNDYVEWDNNDWYSASNTGTSWRTASVYMLG